MMIYILLLLLFFEANPTDVSYTMYGLYGLIITNILTPVLVYRWTKQDTDEANIHKTNTDNTINVIKSLVEVGEKFKIAQEGYLSQKSRVEDFKHCVIGLLDIIEDDCKAPNLQEKITQIRKDFLDIVP